MLEDRSIEMQITSFLAGECSPSENQYIADLIESDTVYKTCYHELKQIWDNPVLQPVNEEYNIENAWAGVNSHINSTPLRLVHSEPKSSKVFRVLKYAVSVAAIAILSFIVFQLITPATAELKSLASGNSIAAPLTLADGSNITLNAHSEVKFPEKFGSNNREVYFWGEAFFEIASDPARPFVIEAGDVRIKVLGTSFNVKNDRKSGITEVVVNSGTVLFYHVDENEKILNQVILHKGDKGVYTSADKRLSKMQNDDLNNLSWKTGILVFNETSLDKVFEVVGKKYGITIQMKDAELARLKLTGTYDNESLDSVLEVISLVHKLQFTHNGKDYLVSKVTG